MPKRLYILLLLMLVSLTSFAKDDEEKQVDTGYIIDTWDYNATVHEDNTWDVTETLHVNFLESRHGIYRHIPRRFTRKAPVDGEMELFRYKTKVENIQVNGHTFEYSDADDEQDNIVIKIGDANTMVSGKMTYTIHYTLSYPDDRIPEADFITHTVLGTECNTNIGSFTFNINFDKPLPHNLEMKKYYGEWGAEKEATSLRLKVQEQSISGSMTDIDPFKGITLHADLPEGFWEGEMLFENTVNIKCIIAYIVMLLLALAYLLRNRRPRPLMVIEYGAPENISSAEVGVIIDGQADVVPDLSSLIVWFASKGYLKIREIKTKKKGLFGQDKEDLELVKLKELPTDAPAYQQTFWKVFFQDSDTVLLSKLGDKHTEIQKALKELQHTFTGKQTLMITDTKAVLLSLAAIALGFMAIGTSSVIETANIDILCFALFFWTLPVCCGMLMRASSSRFDMFKRTKWLRTQYVILALLAVADIALFKLCFYEKCNMLLSFPAYAALMAGGWVLALLGARLKRDTDFRREKMSQLLGFREFIDKSERPMMEALIKETPTLFYDILPYAMVFNLTKEWQKAFENLNIANPEWFETTDMNLGGYMLANHLTNQLTSNLTNSIRVSSHNPSSNSSSWSSGGGSSFSGGGGGGGGVGSW